MASFGDAVAGQAIPMPGDAAAVPLPGAAETETGAGAPWYARPPLRLELSGYLENTLSAERTPLAHRPSVLDNLRFRLNVARAFGDRADLGLTLIATGSRGDTVFDLYGYQARADRRRLRAWGLRKALRLPLEKEEVFLQESFLTFYAAPFRLRLGRHKFYSGTGYAYNPIDLFNRKSALDPTYEVDGNDAVLATLGLGAKTQLQAAVVFEDEIDATGRDIRLHNKKANYQLRLESYLRGWDVAVQYTHATRSRVDYESTVGPQGLWGLLIGDDFTREFRWRMAAFEFAGEIGGVGIHGEAGYAWVDPVSRVGTLSRAAKDHLRFLVGADFTFENQLYVIAEYLHLGQESGGGGAMGLNERMAFLTGETLAMDRDTLFAGASYPITDLSDLALYAIAGLSEPSLVLIPRYDRNLSKGFNLTVTAFVPVGPDDSAVGNSGVAGFVRLRYSF